MGGGYVAITNNGQDVDRLLGGTLELAGRVEIHEMRMDGGVMRMKPLPDGLEIKSGQTVRLEPGGTHMMFLDLKGPFEKDRMIKGQLRFEKAGLVDVHYKVESPGSSRGHSH